MINSCLYCPSGASFLTFTKNQIYRIIQTKIAKLEKARCCIRFELYSSKFLESNVYGLCIYVFPERNKGVVST